MKIVQLDIEGFRSLKNVSWKPGNLNVIIGPNGSGKSNLLRILEFVSVAAQGKLSGNVQSAGGISSLVWDGQSNKIGFTLVMSTGIQVAVQQHITYEVHILRSSPSSYRIDHEVVNADGESPFNLTRTPKGATIDYRGLRWQFAEVTAKDVETSFSATATTALTAGPGTSPSGPIDNPLSAMHEYFRNWSIFQEFNVSRMAPIRLPVVTKYDLQVSTDGQNLISVLHTLYTGDRVFKQHVNSAMKAAYGDDFDELIFPPASDQRIQLRVRWKTLQREQSAADLSDGTLRFLFLVAVLAGPNPAPLIAIDEPETGLHPSMLPIIAELAVDAAERTQVVFTTHSDQFLDAFRETGTRPTTTVARWENGETILTTLSDDELAYWLKEYSLGSLFRSGELENMAA